MIFLGIETSSSRCSVALGNEDGLLGLVEENRPREHARILPGFVQRLFRETGIANRDIDAVAVSIGPGSFTGLRIGLSFAKGLAYSRQLPIVPVPTMEALIAGYDKPVKQSVCVLIHSHGNTFFCQQFKRRKKDLQAEEPVVVTSDIFDNCDCQTILHWNCEKFLEKTPGIAVAPSAWWIVALATKHYDAWKVDDPFTLVPYYISPFVPGGKP
ncbi:MAG: tRNA (adenosine(37)-N6)-threonylcarbamoyltransferase complex dimerization subunit type 1 TsaB [Fidelibacterota bacterium]